MIRRPPRSTRVRSSAASDVYKRQAGDCGYFRRLAGRQCRAQRESRQAAIPDAQIGSEPVARQRAGEPGRALGRAGPGDRRRQAAAPVPARRQDRALWRAYDADERVAHGRLSACGAGRARSREAVAMTIARISLTRRWPEPLRWGACFALALSFHAAGAAALLARWSEDSDLLANAPVMMIDLAPVP